MKHTIEIDGLPEGYEIEKLIIKDKLPCLNGSIASAVYVKKKQPRRIVLEEVNTVEYDLLIDNVTYNIVEYSGENDD